MQVLHPDAEAIVGANGKDNRNSSDLLRASVRQMRDDDVEALNSRVFNPLDSPLPFPPKYHWVIEFTGGSNFKECQRRARE